MSNQEFRWTQLFCGPPDASMLCLPFTSFYKMRFELSFFVFLSIWWCWRFQPQIRPQMELVQKGVERKSDRPGMEQRKMTGSASFRSSPKKTLYQHWRQFTPQFIGGAINRLVWGFCNRYSPPTPLGLFTPSPSNIVSNSTTSNITPQYCFQEQEQDAGGGNKGLEIG